VAQFRHYIITCLNVGVFSHRGGMIGTMPVPDWMRQRMRLFVAFTLPSIAAQTCRNFVWMLLVDEKTPREYLELLRLIPLANLRIVLTNCKSLDNHAVSAVIMQNVAPGEYDLITTEIDSDDAIHTDMIAAIQRYYQHKEGMRHLIFCPGLIYSLKTGEVFPLEYLYHCPTVIESSPAARSVYYWHNSEIPVDEKEIFYGEPYWLQVIHDFNVANTMESSGSRVIRKDKPAEPSAIRAFGVDHTRLGEFLNSK
jgi:hypothetical protein